jgi:2-polyprenyl-3-methyl-5-hydroxy-6-metoxy-1,4-benzoquinol methylase
MRCENCGDVVSWSAFERDDVVRCDSCGGWSCTNREGIEAESVYDREYFEGGEYAAYGAASASHRRNFRRKLELLVRHGGVRVPQVRLLEIGCATGEFLEVARDAGAGALLGIEPSAYARGIAVTRGTRVLAPSDPTLLAEVEDFRPNVVVAWDVWEHLPAPASTFDAILGKAAPDATVAVSTVDAGSWVARHRRTRWRQFHPPTHLHYPTRRSLERFFGARGFAVRHHRAFGYYRPLLEYARALGISPATRPAFPWTLPLYLNLWDIQLVIAARRGGA